MAYSLGLDWELQPKSLEQQDSDKKDLFFARIGPAVDSAAV